MVILEKHRDVLNKDAKITGEIAGVGGVILASQNLIFKLRIIPGQCPDLKKIHFLINI